MLFAEPTGLRLICGPNVNGLPFACSHGSSTMSIIVPINTQVCTSSNVWNSHLYRYKCLSSNAGSCLSMFGFDAAGSVVSDPDRSTQSRPLRTLKVGIKPCSKDTARNRDQPRHTVPDTVAGMVLQPVSKCITSHT